MQQRDVFDDSDVMDSMIMWEEETWGTQIEKVGKSGKIDHQFSPHGKDCAKEYGKDRVLANRRGQ